MAQSLFLFFALAPRALAALVRNAVLRREHHVCGCALVSQDSCDALTVPEEIEAPWRGPLLLAGQLCREPPQGGPAPCLSIPKQHDPVRCNSDHLTSLILSDSCA